MLQIISQLSVHHLVVMEVDVFGPIHAAALANGMAPTVKKVNCC